MALTLTQFLEKWGVSEGGHDGSHADVEKANQEMKADLEEMLKDAKKAEWSRIAKDNHMNYPV